MMKFIKGLFSANDNVSSKRVMAILAFICMIIMAFMKYELDVVITLISFITAMMGLGSIDKRNTNTPV